MVTVFESENIRFVKFTEELADDYLKMVNDIEHVARFIGERRTPYTMEEELEFIRNQKLMQPYTFSMMEKSTGEFIGNTGFMNIKDGEAELGIVITYAKQNAGYGKEAILSLLNYGWNNLPINRVYLEVYIDNDRAIHLYEKCGFTEFKRTDKDIFMEIISPAREG
ncbi:MAG: GNAT family N-acetyltransferase [Clostridiales bacterium]|nr:GNAT family N-acetyltransferase [Clostridiales bacterium]